MLQIDTLPAYAPIGDSTAQMLATPTDTAEVKQVNCAYDTIFSPREIAEPVLHRSLFTHHELQVTNHYEREIYHQEAHGWFFGVIVISIFLICNYLRRKQMSLVNLLQSAIDHRALDRLLRDTNLTHPSSQAPIALIMLLPLSLVGYYSFMPHNSNILNDMLGYVILLAACYAIYFTRNGIIRLLGNAFGNSDSVYVYLSSNYIFHLLYAIVGTIMAFFVCYTGDMGKIFLYITLGVIGLLAVIRFLRGMQVILTLSKTSKFYLFYYLCILEIVPIVIIIKVATS